MLFPSYALSERPGGFSLGAISRYRESQAHMEQFAKK